MSKPKALENPDLEYQHTNGRRRDRLSRWFYVVCVAVALVSVMVLVLLLASIGYQGHSRLTVDLLTNSHSELEIEKSGMWPAILGSLAVCSVCAIAALPLGVGTAVFLEEFKPTHRVLRWLHGFVQVNISNLAGVPSVVYGLLGLTLFVYMFNVFGQIKVNESNGWEIMGAKHYYQVMSLERGQFILIPQKDSSKNEIQVLEPTRGVDDNGSEFDVLVWKRGTPKPTDPEIRKRTVREGARGGAITKEAWYFFRLPLHKSFLSAGLALALVILPIIIIASQEALRAVSPSLREASLGLGSTTWQTVRHVCLPAALPGIMTGAILAMGRAIGEAAPILVVMGAAVAKSGGPKNLMDSAVTMPILVFNWAGRYQDEFQELSAAAIIVLLVVLLMLNSVAIFIRQRMQKQL